ncbi:hypothetical protein Btru_050923 [Bulinus truncatus]|nr:hypothetical protein Btru_050923 [Bulinus truncatus]
MPPPSRGPDKWLDKVLCTASIYHVAFMALDRYFAVCRPLMYRIMPSYPFAGPVNRGNAIKYVNLTDNSSVIIVLGVTCSVLAGYITAANLIIIIALHRQRAPSFSKAINRTSGASASPPCQLLMMSMAVSDAIIGVVSMPLAIYVIANNGRWELGKGVCSAWLWLDKVLCTASIYHVAFMALDRYFAVCRPLMYRIMSKKTTLLLIALSWSVPFVVSTVFMAGGWQHNDVTWLFVCLEQAGTCTPVYNRPYLITVSTLDFYIPFLVIFILYFLVARQIYKLGQKSVARGIMSKVSVVKTKSVARFLRAVKNKSPASQLIESAQAEKATPSEIKNGEAKAVEMNLSFSEPMQHVSLECVLKNMTRESTGNSPTALDQTESYMGVNELTLNPYTLNILLTGEQSLEDKDATLHIRYSNMFSQNDQCDLPSGSVFTLNTLSCEDANLAEKKAKSCASSAEKTTKEFRSVVSEISLLRPDSVSSENCKMMHNGRTQRTGFKGRSYAVADDESGSPHSTSGLKASPTKPTSKTRHNANKAFATIGCIVVCFTVCWLPFSIYNFILIYNGFELASWPSVLFVWMGYANSALNPVFYCFTDSVRQAVVVLLKRPKGWE